MLSFLDKFVNNVLVIDDTELEVKELIASLEKKDIKVDYYQNPELLLKKKQIRKKDLIFLDFMLCNDENFTVIMSSKIRPMFEKHFKHNDPYGIVIWSKHDIDRLEKFYDILTRDTIQNKKYNMPLFVVNLDKNEYLEGTKKYSNILVDIDEKLKQSIPANFFITWNESIKTAIYKTVSSVFNFAIDFSKHEQNIIEILHKLALNQTGIPSDKIPADYNLFKDAYKAFDDLLHSNLDIIQESFSNYDIFSSYTTIQETKEQKLENAAQLNTLLLFDNSNLSKKIIYPGNIYKVNTEDNCKLSKNQKHDLFEDFCKFSKVQNIEEKKEILITDIVIELSPPCDFANKKILSRFIYGIQISLKKEDEDVWNLCKKLKKTDSIYRLFPLTLRDGYYDFILFDFRNLNEIDDSKLIRGKKYELLYRVRKNLFADILQKFSSHASRLGINSITLK